MNICVFVVNLGILLVECGVFYCLLDVVEEIDICLLFNGFDVVVDEESVFYLEEVEIDYVID